MSARLLSESAGRQFPYSSLRIKDQEKPERNGLARFSMKAQPHLDSFEGTSEWNIRISEQFFPDFTMSNPHPMNGADDGELPLKRVSRRNTDIALEIQAKKASSARSKWYEPGVDIW